MAMCPRNMRPVHTGVYKQSSLPRRCANSYRLRKYQVTNKQCVDTSGRRHACTSTERDRESSRLRSSTLLCVKTSICTGSLSSSRLRVRAKTTQITCTYLQLALPSVSLSLIWSTQNISYMLHHGIGMSAKIFLMLNSLDLQMFN